MSGMVIPAWIPANEDVAYERFTSDEIFHEIITQIAHDQRSTPQEIFSEYAGEEIWVKNEVIGLERRRYPTANNTPIRDNHPVEENNPDNEPTSFLHKVIRALKPN